MTFRHCLALPAVALLFAAAPFLAAAQSRPPVSTDTSRTGERREPPTLDRVRVTAARDRTAYDAGASVSGTRTATALRDVPQSISIVTGMLIRDQAMTSMGDVARYLPGVVMGQGEGNRDQPTIRGIATTADFFVDGVRDDVQYLRDLYNVDRVEALKGPNALVFGRGGGGGVLNRVTKEALWNPVRELSVAVGEYDTRRAAVDLGHALAPSAALRVNGMYESSGTFRDGVTLRRSGVNPTLTIASPSEQTRLVVAYEAFADRRTADRGIPSFGGGPLAVDRATFFGDPSESYSDVQVHGGTATASQTFASGVTLRSHTRLTVYNKAYQNVFPGAVNAAGDRVSLSAYGATTDRTNAFSQLDLTFGAMTGRLRHRFLVGAEVGRQATENFRHTGYFHDSATTVSVPVAQPTVSLPVVFRQSASDADNRVTANVRSFFVQDQVRLSDQWQLIGGVRVEDFDLGYRNNRTSDRLTRGDVMVSPRAGLVFAPVPQISFYSSYSVSHLPSAGDQFASLTDVTRALEPERFTNHEVGATWDVAPRVTLSAAAYRLDRTNASAPHPTDPTQIVQTGSQRSTGVEVGVTGRVTSRWQVAGGYANQEALIRSATTSSPAGRTVPFVPRTTLSLWNRYQVTPVLGAALGLVHRSDMYAGIDNTVTIPGYAVADGAVYADLTRRIRAQINVGNLFNTHYHVTAHSNNNISPGAPRSVRMSLTTTF